MTTDERRTFVTSIGAPDTYMTELSKELKGVEYDRHINGSSNMNISDLKKEYENAGNGWLRAAFGSIVRRHYDEIKNMTTDERRTFVTSIGAPDTYMTELSKELKGVEYDRHLKQ